MGKIDFSKFAQSVRTVLTKHSPEILTGIGIAGMVTTTILAVRATPRALTLIEEEKKRQNEERAKVAEDNGDDKFVEVTKLKPLEVVKTTWKCYIPAAVVGVSAAGCLIGASRVNLKRNAALATAYTLSETAFKEYQEKVVETIGEKKEQAVRDSIAKDKLEKDPVGQKEIIIVEKGNTLCYDAITGRYFKSDIDKIKKVENELNSRMLRTDYISLNEFYNEIGLSSTSIGDDLGWRVDRGNIDVFFSSQLASDGTPCLVIDFHTKPKYGYSTYE